MLQSAKFSKNLKLSCKGYYHLSVSWVALTNPIQLTLANKLFLSGRKCGFYFFPGVLTDAIILRELIYNLAFQSFDLSISSKKEGK